MIITVAGVCHVYKISSSSLSIYLVLCSGTSSVSSRVLSPHRVSWDLETALWTDRRRMKDDFTEKDADGCSVYDFFQAQNYKTPGKNLRGWILYFRWFEEARDFSNLFQMKSNVGKEALNMLLVPFTNTISYCLYLMYKERYQLLVVNETTKKRRYKKLPSYDSWRGSLDLVHMMQKQSRVISGFLDSWKRKISRQTVVVFTLCKCKWNFGRMQIVSNQQVPH